MESPGVSYSRFRTHYLYHLSPLRHVPGEYNRKKIFNPPTTHHPLLPIPVKSLRALLQNQKSAHSQAEVRPPPTCNLQLLTCSVENILLTGANSWHSSSALPRPLGGEGRGEGASPFLWQGFYRATFNQQPSTAQILDFGFWA